MAESDYSVGIAKLINLINFSFPLCGIDTGIFWEYTGLLLPREKSTNKKPLTYVLLSLKSLKRQAISPLWEHSRHPLEPTWPLKLLQSNRKQATKLKGLSAKLRVRGLEIHGMRKGKGEAFSRIQLRNHVFKDVFKRKPTWYISILKLMAYTSSKMLFPATAQIIKSNFNDVWNKGNKSLWVLYAIYTKNSFKFHLHTDFSQLWNVLWVHLAYGCMAKFRQRGKGESS